MSAVTVVLVAAVAFLIPGVYLAYRIGYERGKHHDWSRPQQKKGGGDL